MENNQEKLVRTRNLALWVAGLGYRTQAAVIAGEMQELHHMLDM